MMLINLTGAPGAGKSTMAAGLFHSLKSRHWNCELITEYTKELVLTNDTWSMNDELLVFSEKYRRIKKMESVDLVITDSPLINSVVYDDTQFGPAASAFYEAVSRQFDNLYFAIDRVSPYIPLGRMPDAEEADAAGREIISHIQRIGAPLWFLNGSNEALPYLVSLVEEQAIKRGFKPLIDKADSHAIGSFDQPDADWEKASTE